MISVSSRARTLRSWSYVISSIILCTGTVGRELRELLAFSTTILYTVHVYVHVYVTVYQDFVLYCATNFKIETEWRMNHHRRGDDGEGSSPAMKDAHIGCQCY